MPTVSNVGTYSRMSSGILDLSAYRGHSLGVNVDDGFEKDLASVLHFLTYLRLGSWHVRRSHPIHIPIHIPSRPPGGVQCVRKPSETGRSVSYSSSRLVSMRSIDAFSCSSPSSPSSGRAVAVAVAGDACSYIPSFFRGGGFS